MTSQDLSWSSGITFGVTFGVSLIYYPPRPVYGSDGGSSMTRDLSRLGSWPRFILFRFQSGASTGGERHEYFTLRFLQHHLHIIRGSSKSAAFGQQMISKPMFLHKDHSPLFLAVFSRHSDNTF